MRDQFLNVLARVAGAKRARIALLTNAISSVTNFALAITIARSASLSELGAFGVAFSIYALLTGMTRSAVAESILSLREWRPTFLQSGHNVTLVASAAGLAVVSIGAVLDLRYMVAVGLALPGLALYDHLSVINMAVGRPRHALLQEFFRAFSVLLLVGSSTIWSLAPFALFVGWCSIGAAIGVALALITGAGVWPRWTNDRAETRVAAGFGIDYIVSSGLAQLTPSVLAVAVGNGVVGSLRGAATLLGPVALIASTARSLLIPYLAAAHHLDRELQLRRAGLTTAMLVGSVLPFAVAAVLIPDPLGATLLGSNWAFAKPLMPALILELLFALGGSVPFAGHRAGRASGRTLRIRLALAPIRLGGVLVGSIWFGAEGAAYAMAILAAISFATWWISYTRLVTRQDGDEL